MRQQLSPLVYVVDDDPLFNELIRHVLKKFGMQVETFDKPHLFFEQIKKQKPKLCIVDLHFGDSLVGYELVEKTRKELGRGVPIVVASSESSVKSIAHAIESGADEYLLKPLNRKILSAKLARFFNTPEMEIQRSGGAKTYPTEIQTTLELEVSVLEVDEMGISVLSPHLVPKGCVISVSGPLIAEITKKQDGALLTTLSAEIDPKTEFFKTYLEFDPTDDELATHVRNWIVSQK